MLAKFKLPFFFLGIALISGALATALPTQYLAMAMVLPLLAAYFFLALVHFDLAVLIAIFFTPLMPPAMGVELSANLPLITIQRGILACLYVALSFRVIAGRFVLRITHVSGWVWLAVAFYFVAGIASSLFTTLPLQSFYRMLANLFDYVGLFAIIALAAAGHDKIRFARRALWILWASFTTLAAIGIIDTITGFNPLHYLPTIRGGTFVRVYRAGILRGQGFLPHPTALSIVAAVGAILTMTIITWKRELGIRAILWMIVLIYVAALVATVTRTGWLAFIVGSGIWLALTRGIRIQLLFLVAAVLGLLMLMGLGTILYSVVISGFDITQQTQVATLLSRIRWVGLVWENLEGNAIRLLFGYGPATVGALTTAWSPPGFQTKMTTEYLIRLAESGLVGLISFVLLLLASVSQCRNLIRSSGPWLHSAGVFFLVAFVQIAIGCLTLPLFAWAQTTYIFWLLLGILVVLQSQADQRPEDLEPALQSTT